MDGDDGDLMKFLNKVDEIGGLVRNLRCADDTSTSSEAIKKADEYLQQSSTSIREDRTVINRGAQSGSDIIASNGGNEPTVEPHDFMQSVEEDARLRAERRQERERIGKEWKKKGTVSFRSSDYHSAIDYYSKAIKEMPWDISLYTNRALCYNNISSYDEAISDCELAIRFEPKTLRAYVYKGKALTAMNQFTQAEECYLKACELFPEDKSLIEGYLEELKEQQTEQSA